MSHMIQDQIISCDEIYNCDRDAHNNQNQIKTKVQQVNCPFDGAIKTTTRKNNNAFQSNNQIIMVLSYNSLMLSSKSKRKLCINLRLFHGYRNPRLINTIKDITN